jgi:4-hydroxyphenylpyruvate dioxygenase
MSGSLAPEKLYLAPDPSLEFDRSLGIDDIDHVEFYVGNARQAAFFYEHAFGFQPLAYRGPETGCRDAASYCLACGTVRLVFTTPLNAAHESNAILARHGDTVRTIALQVPDCQGFYYETLRRGAMSAEAPYLLRDQHGLIHSSAIQLYGDTVHRIVQRSVPADGYVGPFLPGFVSIEGSSSGSKTARFERIDHIVANVELGKMNHWVQFYESVLGFQEMIHFSDEDISTEYSSLMSKVLRNGNEKIKFPINEPAHGKRKSQIDEFLEFHGGPGVQHIALETRNIIETVRDLQSRGVEFLTVPHTYYEALPARIGSIKEDIATLGTLGILADRDDDGYLLQIFTRPVQDKPTIFFEVIQREGARGFGAGNFKALFEAIEREQAKRGNL